MLCLLIFFCRNFYDCHFVLLVDNDVTSTMSIGYKGIVSFLVGVCLLLIAVSDYCIGPCKLPSILKFVKSYHVTMKSFEFFLFCSNFFTTYKISTKHALTYIVTYYFVTFNNKNIWILFRVCDYKKHKSLQLNLHLTYR